MCSFQHRHHIRLRDGEAVERARSVQRQSAVVVQTDSIKSRELHT